MARRSSRRRAGEHPGLGRRVRRRAPRYLLAAAATVAVAGVIAWSAFAGDGGEQEPATTAVSAAERTALLATGQRIVQPVEKRAPALPVRLQTAPFGDGSVFDLAQERGNVVILYFMAAWCTTCIPEAQALAQIHETYSDRGVRVLVLDVDVTENEGNLAGFREQAGNGEHLWAMDVDDQVARTYNVRLLDTTIFIDREGRIAYMDGSPTSYEVLAAIIEALLL